MFHFVPGYGLMGPAFYRNRSMIPAVAPVMPPMVPGHPGAAGAAGGAARIPAGAGAAAGAPPMGGAGGQLLGGAGGQPLGGAGGQPAQQMIRPPAGGSPLAALSGTALGPALADLISRAPQVAPQLAGGGTPAFPPEVPGMPRVPGPPPGMFGPGVPQLGGPAAPVQLPDWFVQQQRALGQPGAPGS